MQLKDFKDIKTRDVRIVKWPGTDKEVGILLLTVGEIQKAHFQARQWFRKQGQDIDQYSTAQLDREEEFQMIALMVVEADSVTGEEKIFKGVDEIRKQLLPREVDFFTLQHSRFQIELMQESEMLPKDVVAEFRSEPTVNG